MRLLDYQYIYLMRKRGSRKHKIGISRLPHRRWQTVNRAVPGNVDLLISRRVFFARWVERYLHLTFRASRFIFFRAGRGAGNTEWFNFNFLERWMARFWIQFFWLLPFLGVSALVVLSLYFQGNWQTIDWSWWDGFEIG